MIWFGLVLYHINHCRLLNAKSSLYIYIKYIGFGYIGSYGKSSLYIYMKYMICKQILLITFLEELKLLNDFIQLNDKTILFLIIHFSVSHLFTQS